MDHHYCHHHHHHHHHHLQPFALPSGVSQHSHSESNSKPTAPLDRQSFTFVAHSDDLTSKRIKDPKARKDIRSHVMKHVRQQEKLEGKKRVPRRKGKPKVVAESTRCEVADPDDRTLILRAPSQSSSSTEELEPGDLLAPGRYGRVRPLRWSAGYPLISPNLQSVPGSWFLDPFSALPGTSELPSMVAHLVFYWKSVFVPMTFPRAIGAAQTSQMELMVRTSFSDPGSFFGLMSMCAAHRAVLAYQRNLTNAGGDQEQVLKDQDYYIMKVKSICEMNVKMRDPTQAISNEAFDTIINLLTGSLIAGLFKETRIHLTGLKHMVHLRGGITDDSIRGSSMLSAIITTDVKAASGLMRKPVFPLTWDAQPVPQEIQQRIRPAATSPLNRLGSGFSANTLLGPALLRILHVMRDMVFFSAAYRTTPTIIHPADHDFFRVLNCEAEHQLLSYIYTEDSSPSRSSSSPELEVHPLEMVTRVASICFLNHFLIVSPPSSGLGRALTKHLQTAVSSCKLTLVNGSPENNFGALAWALFIGAQGALNQPERPWFVEQLARVAMICKWKTWEQVSDVLADYFFVPALDGPQWKSIWDEAMTGFMISEEDEEWYCLRSD